ncbi:MAG TPA: response regulator, partial [Rubrobacteraceae bacterium]|nr:response regulator [Rubrobacteraceae bacterium]
MRALRILHLEDDPLDAELIQATLAEGGIECEVALVQTRTQFAAALESGGFDLVLADYSLPAFDGLSALKVAQEVRPEVPFVLVSGALGEERAIEALKVGATDYVLKQRLGRLVPAVRRAISEAKERKERKRAEEALREVREAERQRIAHDLHDGALQDLTYALVQAQLVQETLEDPELNDRLEQTIEALKRTGRELRAAVYNLSLKEEPERPLPELVKALVELNRMLVPGCDVRLEVKEGLPSSPLGKRGAELLRILQEALTNARKHSEARNVLVSLGAEGEKVWAEVTDDGRGFGPETISGVGLRSMQERARAVGGTLNIDSEPGKGTKVRLETNLAREGEEPQPQEETHILLVEDHASFREAAASVFEQEPGFEVVGQAGSLAETRKLLEDGAAAKVDVAILDLGLPDGYGGELIKDLREAHPQAQALVLSATLERSEVARAVEAGAAGVLHKSERLKKVVEDVRRLRAGETLLPLTEVVELVRFASSHRDQEREEREALERLTPREIEVL